MKARRVLGTAAAALALAIATPAYASANTDTDTATVDAAGTASLRTWHFMATDDGDPGGQISFRADGDVVVVADVESDGWAAEGGVYQFINGDTVGSLVYTLRDGGNDGVAAVKRAGDGGKYNLVEGRTYWFKICLDKAGTTPKYCDWAAWTNRN